MYLFVQYVLLDFLKEKSVFGDYSVLFGTGMVCEAVRHEILFFFLFFIPFFVVHAIGDFM